MSVCLFLELRASHQRFHDNVDIKKQIRAKLIQYADHMKKRKPGGASAAAEMIDAWKTEQVNVFS